MRVLIVEDVEDVGEGIVACVQRLGHAVDWVKDGLTADDLLGNTPYELVILDLMLPGMDGISILKHLRQRRALTPVLILTARSSINDRVTLLDIGADDYLVKPFNFRELEARIRSLLRRRSNDRTNLLVCGDIVLDRSSHSAQMHSRPLVLTRREFSLLEILMANQGTIFSKAAFIEQLFDYSSDPNENAIEVIVARLRKKLAGSGAELTTHRGIGYCLAAETRS